MRGARKPKIVAIVQARLGSTRLPLKSLLTLKTMPIIDWVTGRLGKCAKLDEIIVAIPATSLDEVLLAHLRAGGIATSTGPEEDVLERFRLAADASGADYIVRVCADNPLIWWEAVDRLVDFHLAGKYDYSYNHIPQNNLWPDGLGAEIVSAPLLRKLDELARVQSQREHCLNYIHDNAEKFKIGTFDPAEAWLRRPDLRLDVDSAADFRKLALAPIAPEMDAQAIIAAFTSA